VNGYSIITSNAESVANARRDAELKKLAEKKDSITRGLSFGAIGLAGAPRPPKMTAQLQAQADEVAAEIERLQSLEGEELVKRFAPETMPRKS
jgi:hypothetical protein